MDELIIEEKRYISSKQAAKVTGYAKDYIGQLCREGRVPARLVGRSWYVLEAAIQDHRFGSAAVEPEAKAPKEAEIAAPLSSNMQAPRYIAEDVLPSLPDLEEPPVTPESPIQETEEQEGGLHDSWNAWFDRAEEPETVVPKEVQVVKAEEPEVIEQDTAEVNVPVRAIHHSLYQPTEAEVLPRIVKHYSISSGEEESYPIQEIREKPRKSLVGAVQLAGVMVAAASVVIAIMGTGYLDSYILTNRSISFVSGVILYDK